MIATLKNFTTETLFDATSTLLSTLHIQFDRETAEPIDVADLYDGMMPQYLKSALTNVSHTYFIGIINDDSLRGMKRSDSLDDVAGTMARGGKYDGMFIFAVDVKPSANLTRTDSSALTRAFNRIACANPVILVIRQGDLLSLATCERTNYSQEWRRGNGEKLGKVNILRNINCANPHRGHIDILETLGEKPFATFDELYAHWLGTFSSELLTKKFYNELSDWYAWAVQVVRFPNDLRTNEDDAKYNHESCIRLITRLIFVWFLKQKKLIPDEFFDESYIREHFIDEFDPHNRKTLLYDAEKSMYYRLILQNLFFAMLNCPIVAEGKKTPNNRRFRKAVTGYRMNSDYNVNNLMRYEGDFKEGGAKKFMKLANSNVPFLNGGLFDCLDDKPRRLYYDGFSERQESLDQLYFPDYLFFGDEVGKGIDLSQWYDDKKKKSVSARGIIDILKRYSFTIEENTPLDQEVSLDPELLGKVFENLLASFNPETKTSARKQTGSFYTPREIVQYMVDESLVAHLKRMCGDELEPQYRALVSYATDDVKLTAEQRKSIMNALYKCRVLDPACGSGAFPMGVLQQMVHVLKRIDPTNEMWNDMMVNLAIEDAKRELRKAADNEQERQKIEDNRQARLDDIESAFNQSINDPDYARKLYLIEHCIYGVDIQPIATQISKLRFFISLVVDQKPTDEAKSNFGIRPLPNLEAKFVTANTLIPLDRTKNLFTNTDDIRYYEERLKEINHRIFLAKKNTIKKELQQLMYSTRAAMAQSMENLGAIGSKGYDQLMSWDMFDQNCSSPFFDPEWMFGIKGKFDVVIGNPPWGASMTKEEKKFYKDYYTEIDSSTPNTFAYFIGLAQRNYNSIISYVLPDSLLTKDYAKTRKLLSNNLQEVVWYQNAGVPSDMKCFTYVDHDVCIIHVVGKELKDVWLETNSYNNSKIIKERNLRTKEDIILPLFDYAYNLQASSKDITLLKKLLKYPAMNTFMQCHEGIHTGNVRDKLFIKEYRHGLKPLYYGGGAGDIINPYYSKRSGWYVDYRKENIIKSAGEYASLRDEMIFSNPKIFITRTGNPFKAFYDKDSYASNNFFSLQYSDYSRNTEDALLFLLPFINSQICRYFIRTFAAPRLGNTFIETKIVHLLKLPIPIPSDIIMQRLNKNVKKIINLLKSELFSSTNIVEHENDIIIFKLYCLDYDEVLIIDPETSITREQYESFEV